MTTWLAGLSTVTIVLSGAGLMLLGLVALGFGVAGGITQMIKDLRSTATAASLSDTLKPFTKLIKALTEFLRALTKAPIWLALVFVGFALVAVGAWLIGQA